MSALTVRKLPEVTHQALRERARLHGRSTEAEVRQILIDSVSDGTRPRLGDLLRDIGRDMHGLELDFERDKSPYQPIDLS